MTHDEEVKKAREFAINTLKRIPYKHQNIGGQSCGIISSKVIIYCEVLDIKIEVAFHRSQIKNHEFAMLLMELAINDLIK